MTKWSKVHKVQGVKRQRASLTRRARNRRLLRTDDEHGTNRKAGMFGDGKTKTVKKVSKLITKNEYAAMQAKRESDWKQTLNLPSIGKLTING